MKLLIINGPNLNMLGIREPGIYGKNTYKDLIKLIKNHARKNKIKVSCFQSNYEGAIVGKIQKALSKADGIVINPGAYTHTSVAILDALKSVSIPYVEVHITDVSEREEFRKISYIRENAEKTIKGKGFEGYLEAMDILAKEDEK